MSNAQNTLEVLQWAKRFSRENEVVKMFWDMLCNAINEKSRISPEAALKELRFYGSNTILRLFRDNPVSYDEVAYDVADTLKPMFREGNRFKMESLSSCESYVLEKMKVTDDDIKKVCSAVGGRSENEALKDVAKKGGAAVAVEGAGVALANAAAKLAAQKAAEQVATEASKKVAAKAAQMLRSRLQEKLQSR